MNKMSTRCLQYAWSDRTEQNILKIQILSTIKLILKNYYVKMKSILTIILLPKYNALNFET